MMKKLFIKLRLAEIDLTLTIVPLFCVIILASLFTLFPDVSANTLEVVRGFIGDSFGSYYILMGLFAFGATLYMGLSRYGGIRLGGESTRPAYGNFAWGAMIFTATMAADIIYFSLIEWALYASEDHLTELGSIQLWAPTFPLFHWGPLVWGFYIVLATAFAFMLHVRGVTRQRFSEACRPVLGDRVDGALGRFIDLLAVFALIAGTATTFSLATPLLASALAHVTGISPSTPLTVTLLILVALVYTCAVLIGMEGISKLARFSVYLFLGLLFYFLVLGGETRYIVETGISSIGNLAQNFISLSTWTDPLRENYFVQNWTVFYWAYWMAWSVATPFFIGMISKGRTIRNTVFGAYFWGLSGTFTSFIILGNYGLGQQMRHGIDTIGIVAASDLSAEAISGAIIGIFDTLPLPMVALLLLCVNMLMFYSTTFDALTLVISSYSHKRLEFGKPPHRWVRVFWAVLLILLPIGLIFSENTLMHLQSVSIIAAFPIGVVIVTIVIGFFKDARRLLEGRDECASLEEKKSAMR